MWKTIQKRLNSSESYVSLALGLAVVLILGVLVFNALSKRNSENQAQSTNKQESTQSAQISTTGTTHTVVSGDTLWSIAEKYYKSGYNWVDIKNANNLSDGNEVAPGQQLVIPVVTPIVVQGQISASSTDTAPVSTAEKKTYTVVSGDTLWSIAVRSYNDGYKWGDIARANKLENPDVIHVGNVFVLP